MQQIAASFILRGARIVSLAFLAIIGTTVLLQLAPGYMTDEREMDSRYASQAKVDLEQQKQANGTIVSALQSSFRGWMKGDLGTSRQFEVPVLQLLRDRVKVTAVLLVESVFFGWFASFVVAVLLSTRKGRGGEGAIALGTTAMLCVPVALLATICLLLNAGGPVFVLATLIAVRDFKVLYRVLRLAATSSHLLYARSQGYSLTRTVWVHLVQGLRQQFLALGMMSLVVALSAAVPVEVIFDRPGLGQLAWSAAMNRDLPVLLAVTFLIAIIVGLASFFADQPGGPEASVCA